MLILAILAQIMVPAQLEPKPSLYGFYKEIQAILFPDAYIGQCLPEEEAAFRLYGIEPIDYSASANLPPRLQAHLALVEAADWPCLPYGHRFYIQFDTSVEGVVISDDLRVQFPDRMTIVLQHQYNHLRVNQNGFDGFSVRLWFNGERQDIRVPYDAVTRFTDPSQNADLIMDEHD